MTIDRPKLANVTSHWGLRDGRRVLVLQNALRLSETGIALPEALAMLPGLCDGSRDLSALRASLLVRAGLRISEDMLSQIVRQMDEALLFENGRQAEIMAQKLIWYRHSESRKPISAGQSYPEDPSGAQALLDAFTHSLGRDMPTLLRPAEDIRAIVSPHIDFQRGGRTYARVWGLAGPALEHAELVVIIGTDHCGPPGSVTLTPQHYRTPWGILPTDQDAVHKVADAIGPGTAYQHELHHTIEHSVELAAVWLHYVVRKPRFTILPMIVGSFREFLTEDRQEEDQSGVVATAETLKDLSQERKTVFVAAADLAHIGPAFEGRPVGFFERAACRTADHEVMEAVCRGDAHAVLNKIHLEGDHRNVCGLPPLYVMLNALGPAVGMVTGYEQCPADAQGTSLVSIAGALLW